jgi:hypothetical protein
MRRRELLAVPGVAGVAAFAATRALAADGANVGSVPSITRKALSKENSSKAAYLLPKNAVKQTRYLSSLTALLSLTPGQVTQADSIFTGAVANRAGIHATMKAARKVLGTAVQGNNGSGITQTSSQLGSLMAQYVANGAAANAAFFQILTPAQQRTLTQYQGRNTVDFA